MKIYCVNAGGTLMSIQEHAKRANRSKFIILGILARGPASGYDMVKATRTSTAYFWNENFGQIYPSLSKMTEEGLIQRCAAVDTSRNKTNYEITNRGRECLQHWLAEPYQPAVERNELLLKLFFANIAGPENALKLLQQAKADALAYQSVLSAIRENLRQRYPEKRDRLYYEATVDIGLRVAEVQALWCDDTMREIRETLLTHSSGQ